MKRNRAASAAPAPWVPSTVAACLLLAGGCGGGEELELFVDLRTDLRAEDEFAAARVVLTGDAGERSVEHDASDATDYVMGARIAELDRLTAGDVTVRLQLLDGSGSPLTSATRELELRDDRVVVFEIASACLDVRCPRPGDDATATECVGGRCISPSCTLGAPGCPDAECGSDGDCTSEVACATGVCAGAVCLLDADDAACPDGQYCDVTEGCRGPGEPGACMLDGMTLAEGDRVTCYSGPAGTEGVGACRAGERVCDEGMLTDCEGEVLPGAETCNGTDDDCDGRTDESLARECFPAESAGCTRDGDGQWSCAGVCTTGTELCTGGSWGACEGAVEPDRDPDGCSGPGETALDDDCDGRIDEGCTCTDGETQRCYGGPSGTAGVGDCVAGSHTCTSSMFGPCSDGVTPSPESCDGNDNDCDGAVDEHDSSC